MFFLQPADVKDTAFLTTDYDDPKKDDDQWLYLPALRKTKRIATTDKSGRRGNFTVEAFDIYSPKIIAGIAGLEKVLGSRCIFVPMHRATCERPPLPDEAVAAAS